MRKFSSFLAAAVTMFAAVSCNKEINNIDPIAPEADAVVYTAYVDGAETKTSLGETTGEGLNMKTSAVWNTNDAITIHNGTTGYTFTTSESGSKAKFTTTDGGFDAGEGVMAIYPSGEWTVDVATKTVNTYIPTWQQAQTGTYHSDAAVAVAYSEDNALQFKNATALLKFTVNTENVTHIVFHGNNEEAITGNVKVVLGNDGVEVECLDTEFSQNENTWTGKGTWVECYAYHDNDNKYFAIGEEYYIAVAPQTFNNGVTVKLRINEGEEIVVKTTENPVVTKANTILDLGVLELPEPSQNWSVCGTMNDWGDTAMELDGDWYVAKSLTITTSDRFKFRADNAWTLNRGTGEKVEAGNIYAVTQDGNDIYVATDAIYDVYLSKDLKSMKIEKVGDYVAPEPDPEPEPDPDADKLYLLPNSNWKIDDARFAAYFFGNGEKWVSMTDSDSDGFYEVVVPDGYPNVIFCRMNPSTTANNWNNKWNQTADLTIPTDGKNLYKVKEDTWDKGGGEWSTK